MILHDMQTIYLVKSVRREDLRAYIQMAKKYKEEPRWENVEFSQKTFDVFAYVKKEDARNYCRRSNKDKKSVFVDYYTKVTIYRE